MAVNLSIKGVPEAMAERLRARAERHHRSLQGELLAIVEQAAASDSGPAATAPAPLAATGRASGVRQQGWRTVEDLVAERQAARAAAPSGDPASDALHAGLPRAVDIIRSDRDSR